MKRKESYQRKPQLEALFLTILRTIDLDPKETYAILQSLMLLNKS